MISGLTSRLSDLEGEVGEVGSLSDGYKVVQEELQVGIIQDRKVDPRLRESLLAGARR